MYRSEIASLSQRKEGKTMATYEGKNVRWYQISDRTQLITENGEPRHVLSTARALDVALDNAAQFFGRTLRVTSRGDWRPVDDVDVRADFGEDADKAWICDVEIDAEG